MKIINIRGCNGSGKTTLLRELVGDNLAYSTLVGVTDHKPIPCTVLPEKKIGVIGNYTKEVANLTTAGCDRIKTQAAAKEAIERLMTQEKNLLHTILFEGVVISTIYQPWADWADKFGGMVWAFLDTPPELCLERIQERNGGKPIKEELVMDKVKSIASCRSKALRDNLEVRDLDYTRPLFQLIQIIERKV